MLFPALSFTFRFSGDSTNRSAATCIDEPQGSRTTVPASARTTGADTTDAHTTGALIATTSGTLPAMDAHATPITPAAINNNTTLADATAIINDNNTPMITTDPAQCRICRGEATDDQPLFHPCLCAGSIKHVHQDCLEQWLKRSGKRQCELCKRPFRFTAGILMSCVCMCMCVRLSCLSYTYLAFDKYLTHPSSRNSLVTSYSLVTHSR